MLRRASLAAIAAALLFAAPAHAAAPGGVSVVRCDKVAHAVVFEGRISTYHRSARMQLRFTLQARTPDDPAWRKVGADGFGAWIAAPRGVGRYLYDKTVQNLLAPATYRAIVDFRWRNARGRVFHTSRAMSASCRMPDPRPDLTVEQVRVDPAAQAGKRRYVAIVANDGRGDAGPFEIDFTREGTLIGTLRLDGLRAGGERTVFLTAPACAPGEQIAATADARAQVDESDEDDDTQSTIC
jgi:CARDB